MPILFKFSPIGKLVEGAPEIDSFLFKELTGGSQTIFNLESVPDDIPELSTTMFANDGLAKVTWSNLTEEQKDFNMNTNYNRLIVLPLLYFDTYLKKVCMNLISNVFYSGSSASTLTKTLTQPTDSQHEPISSFLLFPRVVSQIEGTEYEPSMLFSAMSGTKTLSSVSVPYSRRSLSAASTSASLLNTVSTIVPIFGRLVPALASLLYSVNVLPAGETTYDGYDDPRLSSS